MWLCHGMSAICLLLALFFPDVLTPSLCSVDKQSVRKYVILSLSVVRICRNAWECTGATRPRRGGMGRSGPGLPDGMFMFTNVYTMFTACIADLLSAV